MSWSRPISNDPIPSRQTGSNCWRWRPALYSTDGDITQPHDFLEDRAAPLPEGIGGAIPEDPDILDVGAEPMLDAIFEELSFRSKVLGGAYPFCLSNSRQSLRLSVVAEAEDLIVGQGRGIYIACLYMSAVRSGLLDAKAGGLKGDPTMGNLFQICATVAAAGYIHGDAYWFGHPRPDETSMLKAVTTPRWLAEPGDGGASATSW